MAGIVRQYKEYIRALKREHFEKKVDSTPGITRSVSASACVRVRIQKFPFIALQMRLMFSKDKLPMNIPNTNAASMLEFFLLFATFYDHISLCLKIPETTDTVVPVDLF